jgi:hypothetical protein
MVTPRKPKPMPSMDALLWTTKEVAAALYTSVAEVERARDRGLLRGVKIGSGPWRYRPADVRAYVDGLVERGTQTKASNFIDTIPTYVAPRKRGKAGATPASGRALPEMSQIRQPQGPPSPSLHAMQELRQLRPDLYAQVRAGTLDLRTARKMGGLSERSTSPPWGPQPPSPEWKKPAWMQEIDDRRDAELARREAEAKNPPPEEQHE